MKDRYYASFNFPSASWPRAQALFRAWGRPDLAAGPEAIAGYSFDFDSELEVRRLQDLLQAHGLSPAFVRHFRTYSERDLLAAPLLHAAVNRAPRGEAGPTHGTAYDLSRACPACGTGAVQTGPLVMRKADLSLPPTRRVVETLDGEKLVCAPLAERLAGAGLTGLELRAVVSHTTGEPLPWRQLLAPHVLPPMAAATRGIVRSDPPPCPTCRRDGHYHTRHHPESIVYAGVDLAAVPDFSQTWECFGRSWLVEPFRKSHFADPLLMIKPSVFALLRQLKVREFRYTPVAVSEG